MSILIYFAHDASDLDIRVNSTKSMIMLGCFLKSSLSPFSTILSLKFLCLPLNYLASLSFLTESGIYVKKNNP